MLLSSVRQSRKKHSTRREIAKVQTLTSMQTKPIVDHVKKVDERIRRTLRRDRRAAGAMVAIYRRNSFLICALTAQSIQASTREHFSAPRRSPPASYWLPPHRGAGRLGPGSSRRRREA